MENNGDINLNSINYCNQIDGTNNLIDILQRHYSKRNRAFRSLNQLNKTKQTDGTERYIHKIFYPDLEFISLYSNNFYIGDSTKDYDCLCNMSSRDDENIFIKKNFGRGKVGIANLICIKQNNSNCHDDNLYILKSIANISYKPYLSLRIKTVNDNYNHLVSHKHNSIEYNKCLVLIDGNRLESNRIIVAEGDDFSNQTCIHMILNNVLSDINNNNFIYQYDAFYCKDSDGYYNGFNITELANESSISDYFDKLGRERKDYIIDNNFIIDMLKQICEPLAYLKSKKYGFNHNDFKCRNVFVSNKNGRLTYKLADFDKSSIFYNGIRFYNSSSKLPTGYNGIPIKRDEYGNKYKLYNFTNYISSHLNVDLVTEYLGYSISDINRLNNAYTMLHWIPMHLSYDIYTFVLSLIREPIIWKNLYPDIPFVMAIKYDSQTIRYQYDERVKYPDFWNLLFILFKDKLHNIIILNMEQVNTYSKENNYETKIVNLAKLRSITGIIVFLSSNNIDLYNDIDPFYEYLGIKSPSDYNNEIGNSEMNNRIYQLTGGGFFSNREYHICTTKCNNGNCNTNRYSYYGSIYDNDTCYEPVTSNISN